MPPLQAFLCNQIAQIAIDFLMQNVIVQVIIIDIMILAFKLVPGLAAIRTIFAVCRKIKTVR
jgi:hypothetical protein